MPPLSCTNVAPSATIHRTETDVAMFCRFTTVKNPGSTRLSTITRPDSSTSTGRKGRCGATRPWPVTGHRPRPAAWTVVTGS